MTIPSYFSAPIAGLHSTAETVDLAGYTIPKNTVIITNYYSLHMDPKLWPEPELFKPERFLDEQGALKKTDQYMPFGIGMFSKSDNENINEKIKHDYFENLSYHHIYIFHRIIFIV